MLHASLILWMSFLLALSLHYLHIWCPLSPREDIRYSTTRVRDGCEPPWGFWELNLGSLEYKLLITTEPSHALYIFKYLFVVCMSTVHLCVLVRLYAYVWRGPHSLAKGDECSRASVTGNCELPGVDAENWTWVLSMINDNSYMLTHFSSPYPYS